jgi:hypothetical protein
MPKIIHKPAPPRKVTNARDLMRYDSRFVLIPLHMPDDVMTLPNGVKKELGKAPRDPNWTTRKYNSPNVRTNALADGRNVGVQLAADMLVIDVDPKHGGLEGFANLCHDIGIDSDKYPRVITGSGGFHVYMAKPADVLVRDTLEAAEYKGVEFKSAGRQVVAAGSIHPNGNPYRWSAEHPGIKAPLLMVPKRLLKLITRPEHSGVTGGGQYTPEQIAKALARLDVGDFDSNDKWFPLMQACHHASAGDARQEWIDWSTSDERYQQEAYAIGKRWDSLHSDRDDGVTYRTLNMILREHGAADAQAAAPVDDDEFPDDDGDGDGGEAMPWDDDAPADDDEAPQGAAAEFENMEDDDVPAEEPRYAALDEWQYVVQSMQFIHDDGAQIWNDRQFGMKFGFLTRKGDLITHIKQGKVPMRKFDRQVYIPNSPPVVDYDGAPAFNIWRPSAMTPKAGDHQWFLEHIAYMFPDRLSQRHVLDYMAQLIQFPEIKIHFALLIQSRQGVGKGSLAMILRRIIGARNCVEPSNDEVIKQWTGWQEGAQLAIINELMAGGSPAVLNRLKSPITEDSLRVEKKFGNSFSIPNHMNFFAMTNHKDALPIPADDRRWLILFSKATARGEDYYDGFFQNLHDDSKVAAVMQFLLDRFITFNPKGKAPQTEAKFEMEERSKTDDRVLLEAMLDERRAPFDFDLVRVLDIVARVGPHAKNMNNAGVLKFLDDVGARKLRRYKKGDLPTYQLYAVRDHDRWDSMKPGAVLKEYHAATADEE